MRVPVDVLNDDGAGQYSRHHHDGIKAPATHGGTGLADDVAHASPVTIMSSAFLLSEYLEFTRYLGIQIAATDIVGVHIKIDRIIGR